MLGLQVPSAPTPNYLGQGAGGKVVRVAANGFIDRGQRGGEGARERTENRPWALGAAICNAGKDASGRAEIQKGDITLGSKESSASQPGDDY